MMLLYRLTDRPFVTVDVDYPIHRIHSILEVPPSVHLMAVCTGCGLHAELSAPYGYALDGPQCCLRTCAGGVWRVPLRPLPRT